MKLRKRTGAISCTRCNCLVDVLAARCPKCNAWRPGAFGYGPALCRLRQVPFRDGIVAMCAMIYVGSVFLFVGDAAGGLWAQLAPTPEALFILGGTGLAATSWGRWDTLVTAVFLHADLWHLLFNMVWLWQLSAYVQRLYDGPRLFLVFVLSGIAGNALSVGYDLASGTPGGVLVGASGGVYGMFGALVWYGWRRKGVFGANVLMFGAVWAGIGFALSAMVPRIAFLAHLGGFAFGMLAGAMLGFEEWRRSGPWTCVVTVLAALGVIAAFVLYLGFPPRELEFLVEALRNVRG